jgi:hypothetical protein
MSCLTFIMVDGSMAAEDICSLDVDISGIDGAVGWNEIRKGGA